jgi:hypothetical protein
VYETNKPKQVAVKSTGTEWLKKGAQTVQTSRAKGKGKGTP